MRILVDENIPKITVRSLQEMGHDVRDIRGTTLEGIKDKGIWGLIQKENRMLITTDPMLEQSCRLPLNVFSIHINVSKFTNRKDLLNVQKQSTRLLQQ